MSGNGLSLAVLWNVNHSGFNSIRTRIPGVKTASKEREETNFFPTFFCSYKFHMIENYFILEMLKKMWANFQRIIELYTQKNCP